MSTDGENKLQEWSDQRLWGKFQGIGRSALRSGVEKSGISLTKPGSGELASSSTIQANSTRGSCESCGRDVSYSVSHNCPNLEL